MRKAALSVQFVRCDEFENLAGHLKLGVYHFPAIIRSPEKLTPESALSKAQSFAGSPFYTLASASAFSIAGCVRDRLGHDRALPLQCPNQAVFACG